jgi:hypothetical protein
MSLKLALAMFFSTWFFFFCVPAKKPEPSSEVVKTHIRR